KPELQVSVHVPLLQEAVAFSLPQAVPHEPQWLTLDVVSVSQPLSALPSQSPKPPLQLGLQAPATQGFVPLSAVHAELHVPQLLASVSRLVSQPLSGLPSQSPKPVAQLGTQTPFTHAFVLFRPTHLIPQPPQLLGSVFRLASQ